MIIFNGEKNIVNLIKFTAMLSGNIQLIAFNSRGDTCIESVPDQSFTEDQKLIISQWGDAIVTINSPNPLDLRVDVGTLIQNDVTPITADPDNAKYILVSVVMDDITKVLSIDVTTQLSEDIDEDQYQADAGKTLIHHIGHWMIEAAGTEIKTI